MFVALSVRRLFHFLLLSLLYLVNIIQDGLCIETIGLQLMSHNDKKKTIVSFLMCLDDMAGLSHGVQH